MQETFIKSTTKSGNFQTPNTLTVVIITGVVPKQEGKGQEEKTTTEGSEFKDIHSQTATFLARESSF